MIELAQAFALAFACSTGRRRLSDNWSMCATSPDQFSEPPLSADVVWQGLPELMSVAAALRASQQWSLAGTPKRFDAQDWWFQLHFDAPDHQSTDRLVLGFDGLATVAEVWLNGVLLLVSRNMFVAHTCDVTDALRPVGNKLVIVCRSLDKQLAQQRGRPRWRAPMIAHQQLRWFRTTLLGRTPGWSPPVAVVGPWKDVWLESMPSGAVENRVLTATLEGTVGKLVCRLHQRMTKNTDQTVIRLLLIRGDTSFVQALTYHPASQTYEGELRIPQVDLWWPHTHGEPCLYRASLQIHSADAAVNQLVDLGVVGFRTVSLKTQDASFSVEVNGTPIFCRGAVWTPLDPVSLRSTPEQCQAAVAQAREAGMNMLRVAGTMAYEEPHFYDACDAQGILVWQDFMFANMDYPAADESFKASVALEVGQQLQLLRNRPCLAVLCGNSEVEQQAAMWGAPAEVWHPALFTQVIAQLCAEHAPGIPYWPSSAHGGAFPHQASVGTSSYYGVGAYLRSLEDARHSDVKFATECLAFANVPSENTIKRMPAGLATRVHDASWKARSPRDSNAGWDFDDVRDHYFEQLLQTDTRPLRRCDHDRYLTWSRIVSGEVMAASMTEWRRPASSCQGALVLFLRDLWAGAGWGLIDDSGQPKACYHYLKRVQQPCTVLLTDEGVNGLWIHLHNEQAHEVAVELELSAWLGGDVRVAHGRKALTLPARSAQSLSTLDLLGAYFDLTHACQFGPRVCDAVVVTMKGSQGLSAQAVYFCGGLQTTQESDVGLSAQATLLDLHTAVVTVRSKRFAHGVHFDVPGFQADDDFFHLPPESEVRVIFRSTGSQAFSGQVIAANSLQQTSIQLLSNKTLQGHTQP